MIPVDVLDDREVDQLLEGTVPAGRDELAPLAALVAMIRSAFSGRQDHDVDAIRLQRPVIRRLALLATTDNGDPAAMPVSNVDRPRPYEVSGLPKWRRFSVSALLTSLLSSVTGKIAIGAVSLAAVTGGVAATTSGGDPDKVVVSTVSETDDTTTTVDDSTTETTAGVTETTAAATDDSIVDDATLESQAAAGETEGDAETDAVVPKDNHGAVVSEAAKDHSHDEECGNHGRHVSSVARGQESCTPPPGQAKKDAAAAPSAARPAAPPAESDVESDAGTEAAPDHAGEPGPPPHAQANGRANQDAKGTQQDG